MLTSLALVVSLVPGFLSPAPAELQERQFQFANSSQGFPFTDILIGLGDFEFECEVVMTSPGTLFDTIGLDAASIGDWALAVEPDTHLVFRVWDGSKWVAARSTSAVRATKSARINLTRSAGVINMALNGRDEGSVHFSGTLVTRTLCAGDYKGDEHWGTGYRIHQGMVGTLRVLRAGPPQAQPTPAERGTDKAVTLADSRGFVRVYLPAGSAMVTPKLDVQVLDAPPAEVPDGIRVVATTEVSVGDQHEFQSPITVSIPATGIDKPGDVRAALWDRDLSKWTILPTKYDAGTKRIQARTLHLSPISWWVLTQWLHDVVETEHFKITYRKSAVQGDRERSDLGWPLVIAADSPDPIGLPMPAPKDGVPIFIQDLAQTLEYAYQSYKTAGFPVPTWTSTDVIVGSGNLVEEPFREKITGMVFCPAQLGLKYVKPGVTINRRAAVRVAIAHELFHVVEGQTFSIPGLAVRKWFIEAAAEYASRRIAFGPRFQLEALSTTVFALPLTWPEDEQNYQTAHFLEYCVSKQGLRFKQLYDAICGKATTLGEWTLSPATYLSGAAAGNRRYALTVRVFEDVAKARGTSLVDCYRGFQADSLFVAGSPLRPETGPEPAGVRQASGLSAVYLTKDKPSLDVNLAPVPEYSARIVPIAGFPGKTDYRVTLTGEVPFGLIVDLYLINGDLRTAKAPAPVGTFATSSLTREVVVRPEPRDTLYVVGTNWIRDQVATTVRIAGGTPAKASAFTFKSISVKPPREDNRTRFTRRDVSDGNMAIAYSVPPLKGGGGVVLAAGYTETLTATWSPLPKSIEPGMDLVIDVQGTQERDPEAPGSPTVTVSALYQTAQGFSSYLTFKADRQEAGQHRTSGKFTCKLPSPPAGTRFLSINITVAGAIVGYVYEMP